MQTVQKMRSALLTAAILLWAGVASAVTGTLTPIPYLTIVDGNGASISGACIWTYVAGTSTPVTTWTDKALSVANTNPVQADGSGRAVIYLLPGSSYKFVVETACTPPAHGTTIRTQDNIDAVPASASALDVSGTAGETLTAGQAVYLADGSGGKTAGLWYKADTGNPYSSTTPLLGMATSNIATSAIGSIRLGGQITGLSSLTVGALYYISTGGAITTTPPTTRRLIGQADSTTTLILAPDPWVPFMDLSQCNGRLTLTTGVPITTADVTGASAVTIFFTPYKGNRCAFYDGAQWTQVSFSEISVAVPATTSTMYDVFGFFNAGAASLEVLAWTNDTTRATALVLQDGVYSKSGALTRRYLGSFRTTTVSGQTEDSLVKRYLWNLYNQVERPIARFDTSAMWTYNTNTWRQGNNAAANQLDVVLGQATSVTAQINAVAACSAGAASFAVAIGLDSTTTPATGEPILTVQCPTAGIALPLSSNYSGFPGVGRHTLVWLEVSPAAAGNNTFGSGTAAAGGTTTQAGLSGRLIH